jgi:cobalt-zinc-cadmium efflux system protein
LLNAVILLVAVGVIISESIEKLLNPRPVEGGVVIVVASAGVLINAFTAWLFLRDKDRDLNIKGAYLHMAADALVSVGVAISGVIIMYTGWSLIDPVIGLVVAGVIIYSTWSLLHDSIRLSLDGVPVGIDCDRIVSLLREIPGVSDIHHLHIWALSTTETALTVHVELSDASELEKLKREIKRILSANRVTHTTIEFETVGCGCSDLCK